MKRIELKTDLICPPDIFWTHRKTNSADIYFLSNQKLEKRTESLVFRVEGKVPELWNPVNGEIRKQAAFISDTKKGTVELPITLDSGCSVFVVFREKSDHFSPIVPDSVQPGDQWTRDSKGWVLESSTAGTRNVKTQDGGNFSVEISQTPQECEISGSWEVKFDPKWGGPESITFEKLESWSNRPEPGVKYYSGEGTYLKTFGISDDYVKSDRRLTLDLGEVFGFVCVKLNGKEIATLWNPPYTFDITDAVKVGENSLEISIVNTWWNRLVGDSQSDAKEKYTFATTHIWNEKSELLPAGILGPVKLRPTRIVNVPKP